MSADVVIGVGGPVCLLAGVLAKGFFDRKVTQATAVNAGAEALKSNSESGKFDADAAQVIAATTITLLQPLQAEVTELRKRVETLEDKNVTTTGKLRRAVAYIKILKDWMAEHHPDDCPPPTPLDLGL